MTLKVHVIYNHLEDYFDWTATSLKFLNGEAVETAHSTIRIAEERHGLIVRKNIGSEEHLQKALKSHIWHNSRKAGIFKPSHFHIRSPRGSPNHTKNEFPFNIDPSIFK